MKHTQPVHVNKQQPISEGITKEPEDTSSQWKDKYIRALADYQNLEKRIEQERVSSQRYASELMLRELLPIGEMFEKAEQHLHDQGLTLALRQYDNFLTRQGISRIETIGKSFDPLKMECVSVSEEGEDGIVIEDVSRGYMLYEKVLHVAKVVVGKKKVA